MLTIRTMYRRSTSEIQRHEINTGFVPSCDRVAHNTADIDGRSIVGRVQTIRCGGDVTLEETFQGIQVREAWRPSNRSKELGGQAAAPPRLIYLPDMQYGRDFAPQSKNVLAHPHA
ncbi:hypothetical protein TNCV_5108431 [Trichonephila clavipes]|nr:hypothetical protein TNCV_5108431 [Trichonephila clavipes]